MATPRMMRFMFCMLLLSIFFGVSFGAKIFLKTIYRRIFLCSHAAYWAAFFK